MISAAILLAAWMAVLRFSPFNSDSRSSFSKSLYWALSFVVAAGGLYVVYYIQINLLPSLWWNRLFILAELLASCLVLFQALTSMKALRWFCFPFNSKGRYLLLLSLASVGLLAFFASSTSSPLNWDVNAYNLSRVSTMLSEASTFLPVETASPRQAVYSLGHDLLFYPDLAWGNLRGLPLICVIQFTVLLGVVLELTNALFRSACKSNIHKSEKSMLVLAIAWGLLLNSNQPVMQAVISKNDLFVTLLYTLSIGFGTSVLSKLEEAGSSAISSVFAMVFLALIGLSVKSYGLILFIPIFGLLLSAVINRNLAFVLLKGRYAYQRPTSTFWIVVGLICGSICIIEIMQRGHIHSEWSGSVDGITALWTNTHGSLWVRASTGFLNAQRILFQGLLFPLTTLKPYLPIGPELQSPIPQSWVPFWLSGASGSAGSAYPYQLLFGTNPDMAYPFLLFWIGLGIGGLGWILRRTDSETSEAVYIFGCSFMAFAFFSLALLYQPWISRFLGPTYIPLVPVAAVGIGLLLEPIELSSDLQRRFSSLLVPLIALISFLPLISSLSLSGYISKRAGLPQDGSYFYQQYLSSQAGLNQLEAISLVDILRDSSFEQRTLCASGSTWTLTPMVLTQASDSFEDNARLSSREVCSEEIEVLTGGAVVMDKGEVIEIDGHQFIDLP